MADVVQKSQTKLTPQQRNQLFARATRQNLQTLPAVTVIPGGSATFELPKTRLLSKIGLLVKGKINAKHATATTFTPATYAPFNLFKQVRLEANNGFSPFKVSGKGLYLYNLLNRNPESLSVATDKAVRSRCLMEQKASATGVDNEVHFYVEMPIMLNKRDPIGLINTQNPQTVVTVSMDFEEVEKMLSAATGFTLTTSLTVTPIIESFTIPPIEQAVPDVTVLKLVNQYEQAITGAGDVTFKFPIGTTYRRIIIVLENADGTGMSDADLSSFQLIFNQADTPYRIDPMALQALNQEAYGQSFKNGVWVWDFADGGIPGYSGMRDVVDTERLTEFWFKTTVPNAGNLTIIAETLAQLAG